MRTEKNFRLRGLNTFGIDVIARDFGTFSDVDEFKSLQQIAGEEPALILGGGSNILFTNNISGWVFRNEVEGIELVNEDEEFAFLRVGAGVNWHSFVLHCISLGLGGVENLSLIPGNTGASPMQNIGAYGVELKDVFHSLEAYHIKDGRVVEFNGADCSFGYRESVFKHKYKNQFVIMNVTFRLNKFPVVDTRYGAIEAELERMGVENPGIADVSRAVINIRQSKLPDPRKIGNAGSFFKNPVIDAGNFNQLKKFYQMIPGYKAGEDTIKIPAAWLIEQCGWKGYRKGDAGCHEFQPLVLVNYGAASGAEILQLSIQIQDTVMKKFGIMLEREVNVFPG